MSLDRRGCELQLDWCVEPYNLLCCPFLLQLRLFVLICLHRAPIALGYSFPHQKKPLAFFSRRLFIFYLLILSLSLSLTHTHNLFYSSPSIFSVFFLFLHCYASLFSQLNTTLCLFVLLCSFKSRYEPFSGQFPSTPLSHIFNLISSAPSLSELVLYSLHIV